MIPSLDHVNLDQPNGDWYETTTAESVVPTHTINTPESVSGIEQHRVRDSRSDALRSTSISEAPIIEPLTVAADSISERLQASLIEDDKNRIEAWCEMHGIEDRAADKRFEIIARQAVFSLLLKAALYEQRHRRGEFPTLSTRTRAELRTAIDRISIPAVDTSLLNDVVWLADGDDLAAVVQERQQLVRSTQPAEDIGSLHEQLVMDEGRQALGQYRSPPIAGTIMRRWAADNGSSVLDIGVGAGSLGAPFHPDWEVNTDPGTIIGIDRSPLGVAMATTALTLYGQSHVTHQTDVFELTPEDLPDTVDGIVCNPPYTSSDQLSTEYKETLSRALADLDIELSANAPLYTYVLAYATQFLDDGDRMAVLVPRSWMDATYGNAVKEFLLDRYRIHGILGTSTQRIIPQAEVATVVLFLERTTDAASRDRNTVTFTHITDSLQSVDDDVGIPRLCSIINGTKTPRGNAAEIEMLNRPQRELDASSHWGRYLRAPDVYFDVIAPKLSLTLADVAAVTTGMTSGYNSFFYLDAADAEATEIESAYLQPLVKSPTDCQRYRLTRSDASHRVLAVEADKSALDGTGIAAYIQHGESTGIPERPYFEGDSGDEWYKQDLKTAALLQPYTVGSRHFCAYNSDGLCVDKRLVCIEPCTDSHQELLFAFLNSTIGVLLKELFGKSGHGGGALDTSVRDMQQLPVIDPEVLSCEQQDALRAAAESLKTQPIRDIQGELGASKPEDVTIDHVTGPRRRIDEILMGDLLGLSPAEQREVYRTVLQLVTDRANKP
ncbi:Eco57I restriction-modification methylase domain-containing protein [Natronorubrum tibetense]|uniref:site-specific DNA-methyltransferase (adenine-specific) n=1 Tax=Natronorubrum tibetense GA33 TaxID=1114856 RepID=L9VRI4_9EURY|nr:N-6 DNA methylase [Natronorubrum tibetense]ELY39820.1 type i restriction-modification system methyltransferase subunit [Natronorubrum tibetense GA33]